MQICSPLQVGAIDRSVRGKKKELYYRGEEKHGENRDERQIEKEKDLYEEGRLELVTMRVWGLRREKVKGREKKRKSLLWERDCFPKKKFGKQPIENKLYFY